MIKNKKNGGIIHKNFILNQILFLINEKSFSTPNLFVNTCAILDETKTVGAQISL